MKITGIDKDFVDIINYLDSKGFKPWSSCDGVKENHEDPESVTTAYISFLKSPQIIDLMAAFLRDKKSFRISLSNESSCKPDVYYDNLIEGNTYAVYFENKSGELTSYFEKIIISVAEGKIDILDDEKKNLNTLSGILEDSPDSDLFFSITFNSDYQPHMNKQGKTNILRVSTKEGYNYNRNMNKLADILFQKYGIIKKSHQLEESFNENEFTISYDDSMCEIYFTDDNIEQIVDKIKYIKDVSPTLPTFESKEFDYDFDDEYEML